jgi:hypothetical protein
MRKKSPSEEGIEESRLLRALWQTKKTLSQAKFGVAYELGNQGYIQQLLSGRVAITLKAGMAFASHLNCHLSEFSPRLDAEVARIVNFDADQKAIMYNKKMFMRTS